MLRVLLANLQVRSRIVFLQPANNPSILNACPKSNLAVFGFQKFISTVATTLAPSADKCAILKNGSETCINDYNFPWAGATAYNPLALPSGEPGTEALSNTAGNAFTVFPSPVTTLSLLPAYNAYTSVITPAAFAATASANPQSISGTSILGIPTTTSRGGGVATTNGQSTGTGTAASTTATKASSGMKIEGNPLFLLSTVVLVVIRIL
jgi:hypothetical protein